jgi:hypothetical protein
MPTHLFDTSTLYKHELYNMYVAEICRQLFLCKNKVKNIYAPSALEESKTCLKYWDVVKVCCDTSNHKSVKLRPISVCHIQGCNLETLVHIELLTSVDVRRDWGHSMCKS